MGGTLRTRRLAKERLVNAGTVIGLDEQLLQAPYRCTYVTASFVHLFYFDKAQVKAPARKHFRCLGHRRIGSLERCISRASRKCDNVSGVVYFDVAYSEISYHHTIVPAEESTLGVG